MQCLFFSLIYIRAYNVEQNYLITMYFLIMATVYANWLVIKTNIVRKARNTNIMNDHFPFLILGVVYFLERIHIKMFVIVFIVTPIQFCTHIVHMNKIYFKKIYECNRYFEIKKTTKASSIWIKHFRRQHKDLFSLVFFVLF